MTAHPRAGFRAFLMAWLFLLSATAYLVRQVPAIAGPALAADFHIGDVELGTVMSALLLGYALAQIPAGWLAVRLGPRRLLAGGALFWALLSAATTLIPPDLAQAPLVLIGLRFALGATLAVMHPSANQFIVRWFTPGHYAFANGLIAAGVGAGSGLAPLVFAGLGGWRADFWFVSALAALGALVWLVLARDRPGAAVAAPQVIPWRAIFRSPDLRGVAIAYFAYGYAAFIIISWFFIYMLKARGVNLHRSALYSVMPFLAMTVCAFLGGVLGDALARRRGGYAGRCLFGAASLVLTALFLVFGAAASDALASAALLSCAMGALYLGQTSYWAVACDIAGPWTGIAVSLINMVGQVAAALTVQLTPWLALRYGWAMPFYVAAAIALACALAWLTVDPRRKLAAP